MTLSDTSISGTYGDVTFAEGTATFTLKDGEALTAAGLPACIGYTVTESGSEGYTATITVDGTAASTAVGSIPPDDTSTVRFHNEKAGGGIVTGTSLTVKKVWVLDDGGTATDSVTVDLLRNGSVYDTVTLRASSGWTYTWTGLNDSYTWTLEESGIPDGFTSSVSKRGEIWTITNDDIAEEKDSDEEASEQPDQPGDPADSDDPEDPNVQGTPPALDNTPKTGDETHFVLYLTLALLALAGMGAAVFMNSRLRYVGMYEEKRGWARRKV